MIIIGITGTLGAGKGTIVDHLVKSHHFKHYSVRSYLTQIINERGIPLNRDNMVDVANELRAKHNSSFIVEELYKEAMNNRHNAIIESIRTVGEVEALRKIGNFYLFAVDASPKVRFDRILKRESVTDKISYKKFTEDEQKEMTSSDPSKQNIAKCILMADYKFDNNGSFKALYDQVENAIQKINQN